jgi:hypothetical protein
VADIEILVFRATTRIAAATVKDNGTLMARLRDGRVIDSIIMPLGDGESVWGIVERAGEMLSSLEEIG